MKLYEAVLNGRQYAQLEKMLNTSRARQLAENHPINGYELFSDLIEYIGMPVTDGWSTYEVVLNESDHELGLLRHLTKQIFPDDEDHFVKQIGGKFHCKKDFAFSIAIKLR